LDQLTRRNIRYLCFRIKAEECGGEKAAGDGILSHLDEVKEHMSDQSDFGGWDKFGVTWDVDEKAHLVVVRLKRSLESEWIAVIKKNAIDFPKPGDVKKRNKR
jgi:hypothetical protein